MHCIHIYMIHTQSIHDTYMAGFIGICWTGNEVYSCHSWHIIRPTPAHLGWSSSQRIRTRATRHIITVLCVHLCVCVCNSPVPLWSLRLLWHCRGYQLCRVYLHFLSSCCLTLITAITPLQGHAVRPYFIDHDLYMSISVHAKYHP